MLTSDRKFGIEIEFVAPTKLSYQKISAKIRVVTDGSLRPIPNAGEFVSPVLEGKKGEKIIQHACETLKKNSAECTNPATSVHLHLDGRKVFDLKVSNTRPEKLVYYTLAISEKLSKLLGDEAIKNYLAGTHPLPSSIYYSQKTFNGISFLSLANIETEPTKNYNFYWIEDRDRFKWLRNVFYFYTLYSDVMENLVSNSRRYGNMYCIPLGKSYELKDIEATKSMSNLAMVWYKNRPSNGHYDDSRYHNVNLHCYWDRHGTVEIRSHGGTTDPTKILLWVKLHQKIVDKLEDIELDELKFTGDPNKAFLNFIEEPLLQEYVKRLLGYYSGITIK